MPGCIAMPSRAMSSQFCQPCESDVCDEVRPYRATKIAQAQHTVGRLSRFWDKALSYL
jgi:hypothetical protein